LHKLTMLCLDCFYLVFLLLLAKCICPLYSGELWKFWLIFIWFVVKILENSGRISVIYVAHLLVAFSKSINFTRWCRTKRAKKVFR
jgi:hypothetical protein